MFLIIFFNKQFKAYVSHKQTIKNQEIVGIITNSYSEDGFPPPKRFLINLGNNLLRQEVILILHDQNGQELVNMKRYLSGNGGMHGMHKRTTVKIDNSDYNEQTFPIIKNNQQVASVTIAYPSAFLLNAVDAEFITSFSSIFIGTALTVLIIAILIAIFMATKIVNPIKKSLNELNTFFKANILSA